MNSLAIVGYIAILSILVTLVSLVIFWSTNNIILIWIATGAMLVFASILQYGKRYMNKKELKESEKWIKW